MIFTNIDRVIIDQYTGALQDAFLHFLHHKDLIVQERPSTYPVHSDYSYIIKEYISQSPQDVSWESHKKHISMHILLQGQEVIEFSDIRHLHYVGENQEDSVCWKGSPAGRFLLKERDLVIFYPEDAHKTGLCIYTNPTPIKKIIYQISLC